jgi:hypothetical protein
MLVSTAVLTAAGQSHVASNRNSLDHCSKATTPTRHLRVGVVGIQGEGF